MVTSPNGSILALLALLGIYRSPVDFPQDQWRGALIFTLICALTNNWENSRDAGVWRHQSAHYEVSVMNQYQYDVFCSCIYMWGSFYHGNGIGIQFCFSQVHCDGILMICNKMCFSVAINNISLYVFYILQHYYLIEKLDWWQKA